MDLWAFFTASLRKMPTPLSSVVDFVREMEISRHMAPLQDPLRFRARFLGLEVANVLVDDQGHLRLDLVQQLLETPRYLTGPFLENDAFLLDHLFSSLRSLVENPPIRHLLQRFSPHVCHKGAERLIRDTLWPHSPQKIQDADVKRAVLAAWFTWLRQTTGSCFATAPAILVQQQYPLQFLQDLFDLLTFGSLRRIVSGQEYSVPLCPSLEQADLLRPLVDQEHSPGLKAAFAAAGLKHWTPVEASTPKELIEKVLLQSLGLELDDIKEEENLKRLEMNPLLAKQSAVYYQRPSDRAKKVAEWKEKTDLACTAYQALGDCALLRAWEATVASFTDAKVDIGRWNLYVSLGMHPDQPGGIGAFLYERINVRLQAANYQLQSLQIEYDSTVQQARQAQRLGRESEYRSATYVLNAIVEQSKVLSQEAQFLSKLFSETIQGYDRLIPQAFQEIFDPSLAQNLESMIDDSPAGFRLAYKHGRTASSQWTFIRTKEEFIASLREFFAYAEQELNLEAGLTTDLIQYIQTEEFFKGALARCKSNPAMQGSIAKPWEYISGGTMPGLLMAYCNRSQPFTSLERKIQNEAELLQFILEAKGKDPMLMHSPTHAFILHPEWLPETPSLHDFWEKMEVREPEWLADKLSNWLPQKDRALFLHRWRQHTSISELKQFRQSLIHSLSRPDPEAFVDSFLYESLPLIDQKIANSLAPLFDDQPFFTPVEVRERLKTLSYPFSLSDIDEQIAAELRKRGLAAPRPILFADTNWSAGFFGLAFSPAGTFDLWRFNRTGMSGTPMRHWFHLQRNGTWIILTRPQEYAL